MTNSSDTNRDKALRREVVVVTDARLREMQEQAIRFEGVGEGTYHWHWAAVMNELIARRASDEPLLGASFPVHADPTGTTREPPHCPTCECGMCGCPDEYCLKLAGSLKPGIRCADDLEQAMESPDQP